jgi:hypothetical protein
MALQIKFRILNTKITPIPGSPNSEVTFEIHSGDPMFNSLDEAETSLRNGHPNPTLFTIVPQYQIVP